MFMNGVRLSQNSKVRTFWNTHKAALRPSIILCNVLIVNTLDGLPDSKIFNSIVLFKYWSFVWVFNNIFLSSSVTMAENTLPPLSAGSRNEGRSDSKSQGEEGARVENIKKKINTLRINFRKPTCAQTIATHEFSLFVIIRRHVTYTNLFLLNINICTNWPCEYTLNILIKYWQ